MDANKIFLDQLECNTSPLSKNLVLKVITKKEKIESPGKRAFQNYVFMDEKGTKRRATIFDKQVPLYNRIFVEGGNYEMSKLVVKEVTPLYAMYDGELQITFSHSTVVRTLDPTSNPVVFIPNFLPLSAMDSMVDKATFDIVVVVARINPPQPKKLRSTGRMNDMSDILITDDSIPGVAHLSAWNAYAHRCQSLYKPDGTSVVVFTNVRVLKFDGIANVATTYITKIDSIAEGEKAVVLRTWIAAEPQLISERLAAFAASQPMKKQIETATLDALKKMQPTGVQADESKCFIASVLSVDNKSPRTKFSCPVCGRPYAGDIDGDRKCISCTAHPLCTTKMFLDFTIIEGEATYELSAQTKTAEQMLGVKAIEYHTMALQDRALLLSNVKECLRAQKFAFIVKPNPTQLAYNEIHWELKYVERN